MSRPRIPIGGYGEIAFIRRANGKVEARTRFRDWDGQTRLVQATASSKPAAEVALKKKLTQRNAFQPVDTTLTPDSPFTALVDYWLADLDLEGRIAPATRFNYERDMRRLVLPVFRGYSLREIGVARCDALLKQLGSGSYSSAKRARTVLRQSFALAVRHEVLVRNPIDNVSRLHKPKRTPTALTATEVNAIRAAIRAWEQSAGTSGPNPDGQLGQIVEVMLGSACWASGWEPCCATRSPPWSGCSSTGSSPSPSSPAYRPWTAGRPTSRAQRRRLSLRFRSPPRSICARGKAAWSWVWPHFRGRRGAVLDAARHYLTQLDAHPADIGTVATTIAAEPGS